jgi:hypothetical protein
VELELFYYIACFYEPVLKYTWALEPERIEFKLRLLTCSVNVAYVRVLVSTFVRIGITRYYAWNDCVSLKSIY